MARQLKNVDEEIIETEEEIVEEKKPTKTVKKQTKKSFSDGDFIRCHSVIAGELVILGSDGYKYSFNDYGGVCEIKYRDLIEMVHRRSDNIFIPRIIIDDEDFLQENPQVKEVYMEFYSVSNIAEILLLPVDRMIAELSKLPNELKQSAKNLASSMIDDGTLDSVATIRALTDFFGSDFIFLSQLFQ